MNHSKTNRKFFSSKYLFLISFGCFSLVLLFYLISYVLFQVPRSNILYNCFPCILLALQGIVLVFFCRCISKNPLKLTFIGAAAVSFISIVLGLLYTDGDFHPTKVLIEHAVFILCTTAVQFLLQKRRPRKKVNKNLPFAK